MYETKRERRNRLQRERRKVTGNASTHKYEKTVQGFLMRAYRNMQSRVEGVTSRDNYVGLPLMDRDEFYAWAAGDPTFLVLYRNWKKAGYPRALSPTVRRIDPDLGYTRDNVMWATHGASSGATRRGNREMLERLAARYTPRETDAEA